MLNIFRVRWRKEARQTSMSNFYVRGVLANLITLALLLACLFAALAVARADGRYNRMLRAIARLDLLILDDWGPEPLDAEQRRDLLEIIEDRYESRSTIVTSQLPVDAWYGIIGNPTIAVAVLDRLAHNAHRIELKGESLRQQKHAPPPRVSAIRDSPPRPCRAPVAADRSPPRRRC